MKQNYQLSRGILLLMLLCIGSIQEALSQFKVVGYMPSWSGSASSIQYNKLTHINYSFLLPNASGGFAPIENPAKLQSIVSSAHANGVKVFIAIGGWNNGDDSPFEIFAANASSRANFVNNCVNFVNQYNLDGVDIDWEYPDPGASANNFAALMSELANAMHSRGKGLSAAVVASGYAGGGVLPSVFNSVDFLNLMAYDGNNFDHSTYNYAVESLNYWKGRGLPKEKAILGVPFYGRPSWESFATLVNRGANPNADVFAGVGYNGITTIKSKTQMAKEQAGGIMMWELSQDATGANSLLTAINQVVGSNNNTPPSIGITSPGNGATFSAGSTVNITANASDANGSVTKVEFFVDGNKISEDASSPYTASYTNATAGNHTLTARATDNGNATATSAGISITVNNVVQTQAPYGGTRRNIPGRIEAEHYDTGGQNVAFNDVTAANEGSAFRADAVDIEANNDGGPGFNVGWIAAGEWLEYMVNVTATGTYKLEFRVAAITAGKTFHLEMDGQNVSGTVTVPNTGGWQNWQTVTVNNVSLSAGQKVMKIAMDAGEFNLNYVNITTATVTNTPPTVSVTSPGNGATFTAGNNVSITANASDANGTVSKVEFFVDGIKISEDLSSPYTATYSNASAGTHSITARATDNGNASTTSGAVSITVNGVTNNTPPTVAITSPSNGSVFTAGNAVSITANASDANGSVSKVEFFVDGTKISEDASSPYTATYSNAVAGTHSITARAIDNENASTTSSAVSITVNGTTGGCSGVAVYSPSGTAGYVAGSKVQNAGGLYQCKPWPYSGWCNGGSWAYAPGTGAYWTDAWEQVGNCNTARAAAVSTSEMKAVQVYPNPTNNTSLVKLNVSDAFDAQVSVTNQMGVEVYNGNLSNNLEGSVDLTGMESGIYVIKITANGNVYYEKLVKQ